MAHVNGSEEPIKSDSEVDQGFVAIANDVENVHEVIFTDQEDEILQCYDRLEDLRLQRAILEAHAAGQDGHLTGLSEADVQQRLQTAQVEFLEARAGYQLRNSIVEAVLQADPLLKAVHTGANAAPPERALHPLVDQRDVLSLVMSNLATGVDNTATALTTARAESLKAARENRELAAQVLELASKTKTDGIESVEDEEQKAQLRELQEKTREARRKYRIVKSVVSAMVAASGVNWAEDEELQELVLDDEEL